MAAFKIVSLCVVIQAVSSKPLLFHEVDLKRNFEFSLKPIKLRPIAFIKEVWSPLGHFGKKHAIEKRSPFEITPIVKPVEHEKLPPLIKVPLEKSFNAIPQEIPLISPVLPPRNGFELENELYPSIGIRRVPKVIPPGLVPQGRLPDFEEAHEESHLLPLAGIPPALPPPLEGLQGFNSAGIQGNVPPPFIIRGQGRPDPGLPGLEKAGAQKGIIPFLPVGIPPVQPVTPEPIQKANVPPRVSMFTDIARADEINAYLKTVEDLPLVRPPLEVENLPAVPGNSIEPEVPKNAADDTLNSSSLVKGSRLALYFGNILLQVMSEVISSARSAISQYSNKPATM